MKKTIAAVILSALAAGCTTDAINGFQRAQYIANPHLRQGYQPNTQPQFAGGVQTTCVRLGNTFNCATQ